MDIPGNTGGSLWPTTTALAETDRPQLAQEAELANSALAPSSRTELGQAQFLELMLAQLKHQDPLQPMENGEFVAQMAQFSTVAGIDETNKSLQQLLATNSNRHLLDAATLVGKTIEVPVSETSLSSDGSLALQVEPQLDSGMISVTLYDESGQRVFQETAPVNGYQPLNFTWDGRLEGGGSVSADSRFVVAAEQLIADEITPLAVQLQTQVTSVGLARPGQTLMLDTANGERVALADISRISH